MKYRLRIFGAGENGVTPPHAEQVCVYDTIVEGYEGYPPAWAPAAPFPPHERHFTVTEGDVPDAAYHGTEPGITAIVYREDEDRQARLDTRTWQMAHGGGLRAHWEPV